MKRNIPVTAALYARLYPKPGANEPPNFAAHLARNLIPEIRVETARFYGSLDSVEARYPGLDYCFGPHRVRLSTFPHHARLFRAIDSLGLTDHEVHDLARWEGTLWARQRYERDEGIKVRDTTGDCIADWSEARARKEHAIKVVREHHVDVQRMSNQSQAQIPSVQVGVHSGASEPFEDTRQLTPAQLIGIRQTGRLGGSRASTQLHGPFDADGMPTISQRDLGIIQSDDEESDYEDTEDDWALDEEILAQTDAIVADRVRRQAARHAAEIDAITRVRSVPNSGPAPIPTFATSSTIPNFGMSPLIPNFATSSTIPNFATSSTIPNFATSSTIPNFATSSTTTSTSTAPAISNGPPRWSINRRELAHALARLQGDSIDERTGWQMYLVEQFERGTAQAFLQGNGTLPPADRMSEWMAREQQRIRGISTNTRISSSAG